MLALLTITLLIYAVNIQSAICSVEGDVNGDGIVNIYDLVIIARNYGKTVPPGNPAADLNGDGKINIADFVIVARNYGKTDP